MRAIVTRLPLLVIVPIVGACSEVQSVMAPNGAQAGRLAELSWVLFVGGAIIFVVVMAIAAAALSGREGICGYLRREHVVIWGGLVFPVVTLTVLLIYGLLVTRAGALSAGSADVLRVHVAGELWWWRVAYTGPGGQRIESANELRIPVGRTVEIALTSDNVIHSFWVPNLAGKLDVIPGRTNVLRLSASKAGTSRGQCAEYCGGPHALMSFYVVAMPPADFDAWLERESGTARTFDDALRLEGQRLFLASGCGACHTIRGTPADGRIGPDLTHVGSRQSLAAATLPNDEAAFIRWIRDSHDVKPQNLMPPYEIFDDASLAALAAYLSSLE